jgi:arabinogalactan oligomer / maltooligosaccharide transport system permease protein
MSDPTPRADLDPVSGGTRGEGDDKRREVSTSRRLSLAASWPLMIKILALGAVNAVAVWSLPIIIGQKWWPGLAMVVIATLLLDWAYLSKRAIPAKYLVPGTIFALAFQVIPVIYSGYIAFTNFSTGNRLDQEQAIEQISSRTSNVPGSTRYQLAILGAEGVEGEIAFLLTDDLGSTYLGTADGLAEVDSSQIVLSDSGKVQEVDGYSALTIRQIADRQDEILAQFEIPTDDGVVRATTITSAAVYLPLYDYDEATGELRDTETGTLYKAVDGRFVSADGDALEPGWVVFIGFDNFAKIITSEAIRGPFLRVFIWNYAFAIMSVVLTFVVGLALALALNHKTMAGRRIYRALLIIPYALPSFMTALIWRGMLNTEFGVINQLMGTEVEWLRDPSLAKVSVLLVNLWLGFPYMFLISTGALQSIPEELKEAAFVDGATPRQAFRRVTFPMLMVALAPLLIASFAFNFNNFNIIYLLNRGGPPIAGAQTPAGHTDILISYTYRLAFESGRGADWGLASAIAIIIFLMVATISAISFRNTRALEELG